MSLPILKTTEKAFANLIRSGSLGSATVFEGMGNDELTGPAVEVIADSAKEFEFINSGWWVVNVTIGVKEPAAQTDVTSTLTYSVQSQVLVDGVETLLTNNAPNYTVVQVREPQAAFDTIERMWDQSLQLEVVCCLT